MNLFKTRNIFMLLLLIALLTACNNGPTPQDEIYNTLENVVTKEEQFEAQQDPLVQLEQQEKEIYDQIITLGMKEFDQIVTLSKQAISLVEEREALVKLENESIQASKKEFDNVHASVEKLENDTLKKEANDLVSLMNSRYESYEKLYTLYTEAIALDKQLYQMFQKEDLSIDELEEQINKINESYTNVMTENDTFNKLTENYNKAKMAFYKNAGLEVEYKEESESK
ncbi:YkyA family protein [Bacillus timonensis]|nr:YkyA family protein [Bacillus timonensis]